MKSRSTIRLKLSTRLKVHSLSKNEVVFLVDSHSQITFKLKSQSDRRDLLVLLNAGMVFKDFGSLDNNTLARQLLSYGLYILEVISGSDTLATAHIELPLPSLAKASLSQIGYWSQFTFLTPLTDGMTLTGTENWADIKINAPLAQTVFSLLAKKKLSSKEFNDINIYNFLTRLNFVVTKKPALERNIKYWELQDRILLSRSRLRGLNDRRLIGGTSPFTGPSPKEKKIRGIKKIALKKESHIKLPEYLIKRESLRVGPTKKPIRKSDLANFLGLLTQRNLAQDGRRRHHIFPISGNIGEPQLIVINWGCIGLPKGIYHYRSDENSLNRLPGKNNSLDKLIRIYSHIWPNKIGRPQVVIQVVRHYPSVARKYRGINLRVLAAESGGVLLSAQLIASFLDLKCCPLGIGPMDLTQGNPDSVNLDWDWIPLMEFALGN